MPTAQPGTSRARVRLRADANAVVVTIPRPLLIYLGWIVGEDVIVELLEDNSVRVRRFTAADLPPTGSPRLLYDYSDRGSK